MAENILELRNLCLYYSTGKGTARAVDGVSFFLRRGETLALIGESGCGKSSLAKAIIRLLPRNTASCTGEVILEGQNIMEKNETAFRKEVRWKKIAMVFQGAMNTLNPVLKIGDQVAEPLMIHENMGKRDALNKAAETLRTVGIGESFENRYPFELSGGMKQRAVIATAIIGNPEILILDEPTSALDVITQANIMNVLKRLENERGLSYIFITHDIGLSSEIADRIAVMYAGEVVEVADASDFYTKPSHPYAQRLMASVPTLRTNAKPEFIPGTPPSLISPPSGCRFHPRCQFASEKCRRENPAIFDQGAGSFVKCWRYG